jgi:hypothetical protein
VARFLAVYAEEGVAVRQERVTGRVEAQEHLPENPAGEGGADTEYNIEGDAGPVANAGKDKSAN